MGVKDACRGVPDSSNSYFCTGAVSGASFPTRRSSDLLAAGFLCFLVFFTGALVVSVEVELVADLSAGFAGVCAANVRGSRAKPSTVAIIVFFISFLQDKNGSQGRLSGRP